MRFGPWLNTPPRRVVLGVLALTALMLAPSQVSGAAKERLDTGLCAPGRHTFTLDINNPFFPLPVGKQWVYTGREDGERIGLQITVLNETETFYRGNRRVTTRVVEEVEWLDANGNGRIDPDEELLEVSRNFFAQTEAGTVCYFGEEVDIYEGGEIVSHEGAWRADARGNAPGIFMPANPAVGMRFAQEIAPGVAEDIATIVAVGRRVRTPAGVFTDTIKVRDLNPLDRSSGIKFYARGVGLIVDGPLKLVRH